MQAVGVNAKNTLETVNAVMQDKPCNGERKLARGSTFSAYILARANAYICDSVHSNLREIST